MFCSTAMVQYKRHSRAICYTNRDFEIILYGMHLLRGKGVSGSIQILHHCILSPIIFGPVNSIQSLKTWREKSGREFFLLSPALTPQQTISFQGAFQIVFQCFLESFFSAFFRALFRELVLLSANSTPQHTISFLQTQTRSCTICSKQMCPTKIGPDQEVISFKEMLHQLFNLC